MKRLRRITTVVLLLGTAAAQQPDWQQKVRAAAERKNYQSALTLVEDRLAANVSDLEARAWRARLLAWSGRLTEAENEYRIVLRTVPKDGEAEIGLADVLTWQRKFEEALTVLQSVPPTAEVSLRQARLLARLNRKAEAARAYRTALIADPRNREALAGLAAVRPEPRHELRFGTDTDRFNYTDTATAQQITLTSHWNPQWTTAISSMFYQRFGADAQRFNMHVSRTLAGSSWIGVGAGAGRDEGVIPRREASVEVGRAFRIEAGVVRGLETAVAQQWFWYSASRVQVMTATTMVYLPRDWTFTLSGGAARSSFPARGVEWEPTGSARISFPVTTQRVVANVSYSVGAENFAKADEIGHFAAHTYGAGLRYRLAARQDINGGVFFQQRSQGRTQTSVAVGYVVRF